MAKSAPPPLKVEGVARFLRMLNSVDKTLNAEVRDASGIMASEIIGVARARAPSKQSRKAMDSLSVARDRVPAVRSKLAWFYGAEFGGGARARTRQFPPHKGKTGYALYPAIRSDGDAIADRWADAIFDAVDRKWHN